jgi:NAD(P)-dependent dehydrogenase (short-subunit alcohol dehydrogenase family)
MRQAIVLGASSDIGREIITRLRHYRWSVAEYHHTDPMVYEPRAPWDLVVCCFGTMEPIGSFWETAGHRWEAGVDANLFLPLAWLRFLYPHRRGDGEASVCLFSGAGTGGPAPTYSAYAASKVALVKMTELLDDESPDCKFFILGPGVVNTKIHEQTMAAGPARAANYDRVAQLIATGNPGTSHDDIYACLMACVKAPKAVVGGRNICVHLDDHQRLEELELAIDSFKLRRREP